MEVEEDISNLLNSIDFYFKKHRINGVFFIRTVNDKMIESVAKIFKEKTCLFIVPLESRANTGIIVTGSYTEGWLTELLRNIAKKDPGSRFIVPSHYTLTQIPQPQSTRNTVPASITRRAKPTVDYIIINPKNLLNNIALNYPLLKHMPIIVDASIFDTNQEIRWGNKSLSYADGNVELRKITFTIPASTNEQISLKTDDLSDLLNEKDIEFASECDYSEPIGSAGFSIGKNAIYFQGKKVALSSSQFKMVSALVKGYKKNKDKFWSFKGLKKMGAPDRTEEYYHNNDSYMDKIRIKLSDASGIDGKKILERKRNKYKLNMDC